MRIVLRHGIRPDFLEIHLPFEILCTLLIYFLNELNVGYYTGVEIPSLLFSKRRGGSQITPTFLATPQNANASRNNFVMNLDLEGLNFGVFVKKFKHNSSYCIHIPDKSFMLRG